MAEGKLADKLRANLKDFFEKRDSGNHGGGPEWYLHLVVFPSLLAMAEKIDAIEERMAKREKKGGEG